MRLDRNIVPTGPHAERSALFLATPAPAHNDNHERLPAAFASQGWSVTTEPHRALHYLKGGVFIKDRPLTDFDLIWPVGFGPRETYLDRVQLLALVPQSRLLSPVDAVTTLHGKAAWLDLCPLTFISEDAEILSNAARAEGGRWILKPNAGSYGAHVTLVDDPADIAPVMRAQSTRYWLLQRYLPAIVDGEMRTLILADRIVGSYRRVPHRGVLANLAADATAVAGTLSDADQAVVDQVRMRLRRAGIRFAAVDTCDGHLIEVNVVNPGGLATLERVYEHNVTQPAVAALAAQL